MCLLGSTVNWAARLMAKAGPGVVLVDAATQVHTCISFFTAIYIYIYI
jgi:class 3 adenylate cyclase